MNRQPLLSRSNPDRPSTAPLPRTWSPAAGASVDFSLVPVPDSRMWQVYAHDRYLGDVFQEIGFFRWRRAGVDEMRGSQLRNETDAGKDLLFNLRLEGKI